jgi:hypothetical protein
MEERWGKRGYVIEREVDRQIDRIYLLSILCPLSMNPVYRSTRSGSAELSITNSQVSR